MKTRTCCKRCNVPFTSENRRTYHREGRFDQLDTYCKTCRREINREYVARHKRERKPPTDAEMLKINMMKESTANRKTWNGFKAYYTKNPILFRSIYGDASLEKAYAGVNNIKIEEIHEHFMSLDNSKINGAWAKSHMPSM